MHGLSAVQVENPLNLRCIRLGRNPLQWHAGDRHQTHFEDTLLLSEFRGEALAHKDGSRFEGHLADHRPARPEVQLGEQSSLPIHAHDIFKTLGLLQEHETALGPADFQGRLKDVLKRFFRREGFPPLILKIED